MLPTEDTTGKLPASSSVPAQLPVAATADVATPDLAATNVVTWKSAGPAPEAPAPVATPRAPQSTGFGLVLGLALLGLVLLGAVAILGRRLFAAVSARTRSGAHEPPAVADGHAVQATMPLPVVQEHAAERTIELPAAEDNPTVRLQATEDGTILMTESTARMERIRAEDTVEVTAEMAAAAGESTASLPADLATVLLEGMADDDTILDVGAIRSELARAQDTVLDYNLVDLDATAQHVHMPSDLNDRPTFVERRTNVVEALRAAIARDPSRTDLRLKLVETYFAAAATNRRAFAEFLRQQAADPNSLSAADWQKVAMMSQELGLDVALPNLESDDDLANCA